MAIARSGPARVAAALVPRPFKLSLVLLGSLLGGCGGLVTSKLNPPSGLVCTRVLLTSGTLSDDLAGAKAGDCVLLPSGTYPGTFTLKEDVSLVGADGAAVVLKGVGADPVLTIKGGQRSTVRNLKILAAEGIGIAIEPGPANLVGVSVSQSSRAAVQSTCPRSDCDQREVKIDDCQLTGNAFGLVVSGGNVRMERGRIADQKGSSLSAGSGVVATAGAQLTLHGVTVEGNDNVGVLIDGVATRTTLDGCKVISNRSRGVWIQGPVGAGAVAILGGEVTGNGLVGIGARDSSGLMLKQVTVQDTVAQRVPIDISSFEDVGDGIGLFAGTRGATLEQVVVRRNPRSQVLADGVGDGVTIAGDLTGGLYKFVVQRTTASVTGPAVDAPGRELTVEDKVIELTR